MIIPQRALEHPMAKRAAKVRGQVETLLSSWRDPHQSSKSAQELFVSLDVSKTGAVMLRCRPHDAHCAATLLALGDLRASLLKRTSASSVHIEVVDIPGASRWTSALNASR